MTQVPAAAPARIAESRAPVGTRVVKLLVCWVLVCVGLIFAHGALWVFQPQWFAADLFSIGMVGLVSVPLLCVIAQGAVRGLSLLGDPDHGLFGGTILPALASSVLPAAFVVWGKQETVVTLGWAPYVAAAVLWFGMLLVDHMLREIPVPFFFAIPCLIWGSVAAETINDIHYGPPRTFDSVIESASMLQGVAGKPMAGYEIRVRGNSPGEKPYRIKLRSPEVAPASGMPVRVTITSGFLGYTLVKGVQIVQDPPPQNHLDRLRFR